MGGGGRGLDISILSDFWPVWYIARGGWMYRWSFEKQSSEKPSNLPNNPWFDNDCKTQKRIVNEYKHHNYIDIEPYKSQFKGIKQNYHRLTQQKSRCYKSNIRRKLRNFESSNPSEYWKLWKSLNRGTTDSI